MSTVYELPANPVYNEAIRKLRNDDPANADKVLNPTIQTLIGNIHYVKLREEDLEAGSGRQILDTRYRDPSEPDYGLSVIPVVLETVDGSEKNMIVSGVPMAAANLAAGQADADGDMAAEQADGGDYVLEQIRVNGTLTPLLARSNGKYVVVSYNNANVTLNAALLEIFEALQTMPDAGKDGVTPHIGENGNWFLGETDTGISAKGPKGDQGAAGKTGPQGADGPTPFINANGYWQIGDTITNSPAAGPGGKRTVRRIVGTSTAGWTLADCDYLCDGTADDVEINAAIQALPDTGGEIVILDGTYQLTNDINTSKPNVTISGNGHSTILSGGGIVLSSDGCGVYHVAIKSADSETGISIEGYNCIAAYNRVESVALGINVLNTAAAIIGNFCRDCARNDIKMAPGAGFSRIIGNHCIGANNGIRLNGTIASTVIGNICINNNGSGIILDGQSKQNVISGNMCFRDNEHTSAQHTINISSDSNYNLIIGNSIKGKGVTNEGTGNIIVNNLS